MAPPLGLIDNSRCGPIAWDIMEIQVNGESREVPDKTTLTALLHTLNIVMDRVAVEVNLEILEPQEFHKRELRHGDQVEILSFIGGGGERDGGLED